MNVIKHVVASYTVSSHNCVPGSNGLMCIISIATTCRPHHETTGFVLTNSMMEKYYVSSNENTGFCSVVNSPNSCMPISPLWHHYSSHPRNKKPLVEKVNVESTNGYPGKLNDLCNDD